ncbi:MAG: hypothetical protein VR72_02980 [Clostridiaceae bacterium BRH_c20a]|nr:MAG: hypothetical protein VR72_02980 [Clostridiaceae bacterium BRH_c20a]
MAGTNQKKDVRFYSKARNYQVLVSPTFHDVKNNIPVLTLGKKVEFKNGEFTTGDPKEIEFLRNHKAYGIDFVEDKNPAKEVV